MPKPGKTSVKTLQKKTRYKKIARKFLGFLCMVIAVLFLYGFPFNLYTTQKSSISIDKTLLQAKNNHNQPVQILIPKANINLPVIPAPIVNGYWALSETTASYGEGSAGLGEAGNMVIFAHARPGLFYNLKDIKPGNTIYVLTKSTWQQYKVTHITTVYPNETKVIHQTKKEMLTLYTCSGFYDEKRLIVQATPVK